MNRKIKIVLPETRNKGQEAGRKSQELMGKKHGTFKLSKLIQLTLSIFLFSGCSDYFKNDYDDNSPTSGKLKVYYDEGLRLHVKNQTRTFESHYANAEVELVECSENDAVQALFNDSCDAIIISRLLSAQEKQAFQSKKFNPSFTAVAKSGVALITNVNTPVSYLSYTVLKQLLTQSYWANDSLGNTNKIKVAFDKNNSSVLHYLSDSILDGQKFSPDCNSLNSTLEAINYVAQNKNTIAFIDFAWLSDADDSIYKANVNKIKFVGLSKSKTNEFEYPNQSSFKLGTYPLIRTIYVYKKTGDFTLAKGFESYVAGPKGQLTFLKQGLLPNRQSERNVEIKME